MNSSLVQSIVSASFDAFNNKTELEALDLLASNAFQKYSVEQDEKENYDRIFPGFSVTKKLPPKLQENHNFLFTLWPEICQALDKAPKHLISSLKLTPFANVRFLQVGDIHPLSRSVLKILSSTLKHFPSSFLSLTHHFCLNFFKSVDKTQLHFVNRFLQDCVIVMLSQDFPVAEPIIRFTLIESANQFSHISATNSIVLKNICHIQYSFIYFETLLPLIFRLYFEEIYPSDTTQNPQITSQTFDQTFDMGYSQSSESQLTNQENSKNPSTSTYLENHIFRSHVLEYTVHAISSVLTTKSPKLAPYRCRIFSLFPKLFDKTIFWPIYTSDTALFDQFSTLLLSLVHISLTLFSTNIKRRPKSELTLVLDFLSKISLLFPAILQTEESTQSFSRNFCQILYNFFAVNSDFICKCKQFFTLFFSTFLFWHSKCPPIIYSQFQNSLFSSLDWSNPTSLSLVHYFTFQTPFISCNVDNSPSTSTSNISDNNQISIPLPSRQQSLNAIINLYQKYDADFLASHAFSKGIDLSKFLNDIIQLFSMSDDDNESNGSPSYPLGVDRNPIYTTYLKALSFLLNSYPKISTLNPKFVGSKSTSKRVKSAESNTPTFLSIQNLDILISFFLSSFSHPENVKLLSSILYSFIELLENHTNLQSDHSLLVSITQIESNCLVLLSSFLNLTDTPSIFHLLARCTKITHRSHLLAEIALRYYTSLFNFCISRSDISPSSSPFSTNSAMDLEFSQESKSPSQTSKSNYNIHFPPRSLSQELHLQLSHHLLLLGSYVTSLSPESRGNTSLLFDSSSNLKFPAVEKQKQMTQTQQESRVITLIDPNSFHALPIVSIARIAFLFVYWNSTTIDPMVYSLFNQKSSDIPEQEEEFQPWEGCQLLRPTLQPSSFTVPQRPPLFHRKSQSLRSRRPREPSITKDDDDDDELYRPSLRRRTHSFNEVHLPFKSPRTPLNEMGMEMDLSLGTLATTPPPPPSPPRKSGTAPDFQTGDRGYLLISRVISCNALKCISMIWKAVPQSLIIGEIGLDMISDCLAFNDGKDTTDILSNTPFHLPALVHLIPTCLQELNDTLDSINETMKKINSQPSKSDNNSNLDMLHISTIKLDSLNPENIDLSFVLSTLINVFTKRIFELVLSPIPSIRFASFNLLKYGISNGIIHPSQMIPYLIALCFDPVLSSSFTQQIISILESLMSQYPTWIFSSFKQGLLLAHIFQIRSLSLYFDQFTIADTYNEKQKTDIPSILEHLHHTMGPDPSHPSFQFWWDAWSAGPPLQFLSRHMDTLTKKSTSFVSLLYFGGFKPLFSLFSKNRPSTLRSFDQLLAFDSPPEEFTCDTQKTPNLEFWIAHCQFILSCISSLNILYKDLIIKMWSKFDQNIITLQALVESENEKEHIGGDSKQSQKLLFWAGGIKLSFDGQRFLQKQYPGVVFQGKRQKKINMNKKKWEFIQH